jgi:steroid delta-isomerase-like uncharacterized protein
VSLEEDMAHIRRGYEDGWSAGNFAPVDEFLAPNAILHAPIQPEPIVGREGVKDLMMKLRLGLPDLKITIEEMFGVGDTLLVRYTARGTHLGDFMGIPPSGRQVVLDEIEVHKIVDGQIQEMWLEFDASSLLRQLGVLPEGGIPQPVLWAVGMLQRLRGTRSNGKASLPTSAA